MKSPAFPCILFMLLALHFSTSANSLCDPGPYNGYWHADSFDVQITVTCRTSESGSIYPAYSIWSSEDGDPLTIYDAGNHLRAIFKDAKIIIHRPDENHLLHIDRMSNDDAQWERFALSLPFFESPEETSCPISCLRPKTLCQASPFDGYWSTDDETTGKLEVHIRSACATYASGADFFQILVEVSRDGRSLPVSGVSDQGDHLMANLADSQIIVHLPKDNKVLIDSQVHGETQWQRTFLKDPKKP